MWGGYHTPRHWYLFNMKNIEFLGKRFSLLTKVIKCYSAPIFWSWTAHNICMKFLGKKIADILFPTITIFYGGIQATIILGVFSLIEKSLLMITGKASAMYILYEVKK